MRSQWVNLTWVYFSGPHLTPRKHSCWDGWISDTWLAVKIPHQSLSTGTSHVCLSNQWLGTKLPDTQFIISNRTDTIFCHLTLYLPGSEFLWLMMPLFLAWPIIVIMQECSQVLKICKRLWSLSCGGVPNMLLVLSITFHCHFNIWSCMCSTGPFQFRSLKGYIHSSCYYHHQIESINLTHCYHIFLWLCAWDVCYIIFCNLGLLHIHSGKTWILFSLSLCSLWWVQIVRNILACRLY